MDDERSSKGKSSEIAPRVNSSGTRLHSLGIWLPCLAALGHGGWLSEEAWVVGVGRHASCSMECPAEETSRKEIFHPENGVTR